MNKIHLLSGKKGYILLTLIVIIISIGIKPTPFIISTNKSNINSIQLENPINSEYKNKLSTYSNNFANLTGHGWRVREVTFSPVDAILATGSSDGSIRLWNITDGQVLHVLSRHLYGVIALDFSPSGEILASGGIDTRINLWNVSTGEFIKSWSLAPHAVIDLKWSPDGKTIAVGGGEWMGDIIFGNQPNKFLQLLNASNGDVVNSFIGHTDSVSSMSFSSDGTLLASGSWDESVRLWNVSSGFELHNYTGHKNKITSVVFSSDEQTIISGSLDETIKVWDIVTENSLKELKVNQSIWSITLSPINSILAIAVDPSMVWPVRHWQFYERKHSCSIQLWDIEEEEVVDELIGHDSTIESVEFSIDGTILASASWDWTVKLWGDKEPILLTDVLDEWPTSSPEDQEMNSTYLADNLDHLNSTRLHSLIVIRHGTLVFEEYYDDPSTVFTQFKKHTHFSATKSFTSALIGIAIDKGFINSTSDHVLDFFPDKTFDNVDERKESITIYNLLTMTAGIEYDDMTDIWEMAVSDDSVEFVLSKPMVADPGSEYSYSTGASQLLSAIVQKATGDSAYDFAMKNLFGPLGIDELDVVWMAGSDGVNYGGIGLFLTPRNMAKFGQLYLANGTWNGSQVISSNWVTLSSQNHISGVPRTGGVNPAGYGYQFWVNYNNYLALGYGGQTIQVHPKSDVVIVTTCNQDEGLARGIYYTINNAISQYSPITIDSSTTLTETTTLSNTTLISGSTTTTTDTSQNTSFSIYFVIASLTLVVLIHRRKKLVS
ncbi:MAG: serine hydrolase [Candidatus Hodarchaeales archaeon]